MKKKMTSDEALDLHRSFLKEVLADMLKVLSTGEPGTARVVAALEAYWESSFTRREARRAVLAATSGTAIEKVVEPMGRPFQLMVQSELIAAQRADADVMSMLIYEEARGIAVEEAMTGERKLQRRKRLIERIAQ